MSSFQQILKYLFFSIKRDKLQKKHKLDSKACQILRVATLAYLEGNSLRVLDLMKRNDIASPATIHTLLKDLREKGLLTVADGESDGRIKYLIPTTQTLKLYCDIAKEM
jgi:DNA-binding MarR family transcriptional regulator